MENFELSDPHDCHFWIKGLYDSAQDEFSFYIIINQAISNDFRNFFEDLKKQLEVKRTLKSTEELVNGMLKHKNSQIQELGKILLLAADKAWAEFFLSGAHD